ncbi:Xylem serine proteinase 1 precursor, putative [Ricinus communis]|uniref:Xylem serine proteinase 1, putative n=1 Tax=Ricinus communis TaxID=3988 RepID=B9SGA4_RICCO|nr:Xylem serine proteinase 1 precursor, putative [Ricinus communis]
MIFLSVQSYVVYLGRNSHGSEPSSTLDDSGITNSYYELLGSCMKSKEKAKEAIFYSYTSYINGFAATLEDEEVDEIAKRPEVVSVFPNEENELHTTRSWEFLGLERNGHIPPDSIWPKARFGEDIIIGNLDTGIWPESESFNDDGMGPIPSKWKGHCDTNDGVKCNRKLIGARYFNKGFEAATGISLNSTFNTARDKDGHGTHTLATAGGRFVSGANFLGSANGTVKGGSPNARVAAYKVCWPSCFDADILAAFDAAIHDGVDILSISLGSRPRHYYNHGISIGSFHAVRNGILVVCSAGNSGPIITASNVAPWILTVAASTIDRSFPSDVTLGSRKIYKGLSYNTNSLPAKKYYPLIYSGNAKAANASVSHARFCVPGSLEPTKMKGKIVYCERGLIPDLQKSWVVAQAGGVGMILANQFPTENISPQAHFLPTSVVSADDGLSILAYIYSTKSPVGYISGGTEVGEVAAPIMASFSAPGPNAINSEILKPDITAPGVNILAAYTEASGPSSLPVDNRHLPFNIISGTSMSCPHVSGIAGLLKSVHPDWSPAAIKSAIMTTARTRSNIRLPIFTDSLDLASPFNYGSGHIWPSRAMDPGLVYDLSYKDYLNFLCSIGYNKTQMSAFVDRSFNCRSNKTSVLNFNYPSITVPHLLGNVTVTRTLKNVGTPGVYTVRVDAPEGISVKVEPMSLKFNKVNEKKSFRVTLEAKIIESGFYAFGGLVWSDGVHNVRSPLVVKQAEAKLS